MTGMALGYAVVIGVLGALGLPPLMRRLDEQGGGRPWVVLPAALLGLASVGAVVIGLGAVGLGLVPSGQLWRVTWPSLGIAGVTALGIGTGIALHERTRARRAEAALMQRAAEAEHARAAQLASEARLAALEARLHPHFLYNTLNTIAARVPENPQARQMIGDLATLLRFTLGHGDRRTVPLADELHLATAYLDIQAARFGRLVYTVDVPAALLAYAVPPFALQTVLENSVTHVVEARPGPTRARIEARVRAEQLELAVWDDGPGFDPAAIPAGRGLDCLRARLAALYGEAASLSIGRHDGGTLVTIGLPLREEGCA